MVRLADKSVDLSGRSPRSAYDWDSWTDGRTRTATRGKDFNCSAGSFAQSVYAAAKARGMKANTKVDGDSVHFRFIHPE